MQDPAALAIHPLGATQSAYGPASASACAFTSTLFAVYLVGSTTRKRSETVRRLARWMQMGCYMYVERSAQLGEHQSVNPHDARQRNTDAHTAAQLMPRAVTDYLEKVGDYPCVLRAADGGRAPNSTDQAFAEQSALLPLEQALCLLALHALGRPVAATITTAAARSVHTIGVRVRKSLSAIEAARNLRVALDPEGDCSRYESVRIADLDQARDCFYIDFVDSHANSAVSGMSAPGGTGVWIEFVSLAALRDYLLRRYPKVRITDGRTRDEMSSTRNCFDMQVWRARTEAIEARAAFLGMFSDERFEAWKLKHATVGKKRERLEPGDTWFT